VEHGNAVCICTAQQWAHGGGEGRTLPLAKSTLRPPTTREFGDVDMVLVGVESPAKSSRGNLLKISTRSSNLTFSRETGEQVREGLRKKRVARKGENRDGDRSDYSTANVADGKQRAIRALRLVSMISRTRSRSRSSELVRFARDSRNCRKRFVSRDAPRIE